MSPKVRDVSDRKTLYMSDIRKEGRIAVRFGSFFESVNNPGQWVADIEWRGERRYFNVDGDVDRESFKRLPENLDVEIESVGRSGLDKVAIWKGDRRIDLHAEKERAVVDEIGGATSSNEVSTPAAAPISLDQVLKVYAKAFLKAVPMVNELDPAGEQGLTAEMIVATVLPAYLAVNRNARQQSRTTGQRPANPPDVAGPG